MIRAYDAAGRIGVYSPSLYFGGKPRMVFTGSPSATACTVTKTGSSSRTNRISRHDPVLRIEKLSGTGAFFQDAGAPALSARRVGERR